ncbi:MAG TPA: catalase-related domain-containing protein, partial [Pyrinomonadaceae bacterium]|nr:catalase-related domain-containing protein [Pyrinomonadaceae bacterium]
AGERYRTIDDWERDDLVFNLVEHLKQCNEEIQTRMIGHFTKCDADFGRRVAEGVGRKVEETEAEPAVSR